MPPEEHRRPGCPNLLNSEDRPQRDYIKIGWTVSFRLFWKTV